VLFGDLGEDLGVLEFLLSLNALPEKSVRRLSSAFFFSSS
jgi:hypothetical protein